MLHKFRSRKDSTMRCCADLNNSSVDRLQRRLATTAVVIIAFGALGAAIARRLRQNGVRVLTALKGRSAASIARVIRRTVPTPICVVNS